MRRVISRIGVVAMLACSCMDVPSYQHEPTRELFTTYALDAAEVKPFTVDGVVTRPTFVQGHPRIKLSFAAKEATTVHILRVRLDGVDVDVGEDVAVATKSKTAEAFVGGYEVLLNDLMDGQRFDELGKDGYTLVVELAGGTLEFEISVTTRTVPSCGGW